MKLKLWIGFKGFGAWLVQTLSASALRPGLEEIPLEVRRRNRAEAERLAWGRTWTIGCP